MARVLSSLPLERSNFFFGALVASLFFHPKFFFRLGEKSRDLTSAQSLIPSFRLFIQLSRRGSFRGRRCDLFFFLSPGRRSPPHRLDKLLPLAYVFFLTSSPFPGSFFHSFHVPTTLSFSLKPDAPFFVAGSPGCIFRDVFTYCTSCSSEVQTTGGSSPPPPPSKGHPPP